MEEKYRELFDGIRAPGRLRAAVRSRENPEPAAGRSGRGLPRAALAAAVLAAVLAGTALAVEYFGRVTIDLTDHAIGNREGYLVHSSGNRVALEDLSEEFRNACLENPEGHFYLPFASWADAEAFLGVELADNAQLDQMLKFKGISYAPGGQSKVSKARTHCLVSVSHYGPQRQPTFISISANYLKNNCTVMEDAQIVTTAGEGSLWEGKNGWRVPFQGETEFLEYTAPSGLTAEIYQEVSADGRGRERTIYRAHFVKNGALFMVTVISDEAWRFHRENYEFFDPWDTLTEILDAYE